MKKKSKQMMRKMLKKQIKIDMDIYNDEINGYNEYYCGCNCIICNPYYGDFWEYFIRQE